MFFRFPKSVAKSTLFNRHPVKFFCVFAYKRELLYIPIVVDYKSIIPESCAVLPRIAF